MEPQDKSQQNKKRAVIALAVLVVCCSLYSAVNILLGDLAFKRAEVEVGYWGHPDYTPTASAISRVETDLQKALDRRPGHPDYLSLKAHMNSWLAFWEMDPTKSLNYGRQALANQQEAQKSRPAFKAGQAALENYRARLGE